MKQYLTTILLWASLIVGEIHTFWEDSTASANWILIKDVTMPVQWNVKFVGDEISGILIALAILFYQRNRINATAAKVFVIFYVTDFLLFFYSYKQEGYEWVYLIIMISWILIYNRNGKRNRTTERQRIIIKT